MSKRIKTSDLEIAERGFPLLVSVEPKRVSYLSTAEYKLPLLHISARIGTKTKASPNSYDQYFSVTHCNRPLQHVNTHTSGLLDTDNFRLCAQCAKQQSHAVALVEYHQWIVGRDRREQVEREQKEKEDRKERGELRDRLVEFGSEFFEELPVEWLGQPGMAYGMRVEFIGHTYEIKEIE